jgi:hypothetical protein
MGARELQEEKYIGSISHESYLRINCGKAV